MLWHPGLQSQKRAQKFFSFLQIKNKINSDSSKAKSRKLVLTHNPSSSSRASAISVLNLNTFNRQIRQCQGVYPPLVVKKKYFLHLKQIFQHYFLVYISLYKKSEENPLLPTPRAKPLSPKTSHPSKITTHDLRTRRGGGDQE